jgi:hypothetical protein
MGYCAYVLQSARRPRGHHTDEEYEVINRFFFWVDGEIYDGIESGDRNYFDSGIDCGATIGDALVIQKIDNEAEPNTNEVMAGEPKNHLFCRITKVETFAPCYYESFTRYRFQVAGRIVKGAAELVAKAQQRRIPPQQSNG